MRTAQLAWFEWDNTKIKISWSFILPYSCSTVLSSSNKGKEMTASLCWEAEEDDSLNSCPKYYFSKCKYYISALESSKTIFILEIFIHKELY